MNYEKFQDYLWYLVHRPFKGTSEKESDIYILFKALGKVLDRMKQDIFKLRRQAIISTADSKALEMHGIDRRIQKYADETYEQYRSRLLAKREVAEMAGSYEGIMAVLRSLGLIDAYIEPLFLTNPERWAEFYIRISEANMDVVRNFEIVKREVRIVKQGTSLPNYSFNVHVENKTTYQIGATSIHRAAINFWSNRRFYLDGSWKLDGSTLLTGNEENLELHDIKITNRLLIANENNIGSSLTTKKNYWVLDGSYALDGSRMLNAELIEEVL